MVRRSIERVLQFGSVSKAQLDTDLCFFIAAYARDLAAVKQEIATDASTCTCRSTFAATKASQLLENHIRRSNSGIDTIPS